MCALQGLEIFSQQVRFRPEALQGMLSTLAIGMTVLQYSSCQGLKTLTPMLAYLGITQPPATVRLQDAVSAPLPFAPG